MYSKLFVFVALFVVFVDSRSVNCPSFCICDMVDNLRRTACTNRTIAVIEYDVPKEVQLLDMSYNHIAELRENVFIEMDVIKLKILNISHNHLFNIHMNAFNGLTNLKTMDLSYNSIQYILPEWTKNLISLRELYLRGNNLKEATNQDVFRVGKIFVSQTLQVLDLSQCGIISIKYGIFSDLPNLEILDLSGNRLKQIKPITITPLKNLLILNLKDNLLECNRETNATMNYLKKMGIRNQNPCFQKKKPSVSKFERLVEAPMAIPKNFWLLDEEDPENNSTSNNTSICSKMEISDHVLLEKIISLNPWLFILLTFLSGLLIGLMIGCIVKIPDIRCCCTCSQFIASLHIKSRRSIKKTRRNISRSFSNLRTFSRNFSNPGNNELTSTLVTSEFDLSSTTPTFPRRDITRPYSRYV